MKTIEYHTMDKSEWARGPWDDEPDKKQWQDKATGYACMIRRNMVGALCGYVGVPEGHPDYGKDYDDVGVTAHGGLNFAGHCQPGDESEALCHVVEEGEDDKVWWLGFDCSHCYDLMPASRPLFDASGDIYRDFPFVESEVESLALQLGTRQ